MRALHLSLFALTLAGCDNVTDKGVGDPGANSVPVIGSVTLTPDPGYEATVFSCNPAGVADDDGEEVTVEYLWRVNGVEVTATGQTLTGSDFNKGDTIGCSATPSDATESGLPVASNTVDVLNTPPRGVSVLITPDPADPNDVLTGVAAGWSDDDGDSEDWQWEWFVNGAAAGGGTNTLVGPFTKNDAVFVVCTPDDRTDLGDPLQSQTIIIGNSPPDVQTVTVTPALPFVDDVLICTPNGAVDADGDFITFAYAWFVNGLPAGSGTDLLVRPNFERDDDVYCEVTPNDGIVNGVTVQSNEVTVLNSPPVLTSVTLAPTPAFENDVLTCIAAGMSDEDGDPVNLTFEWTVGGLPSANTGTTITGANFNKGNAVVCTVTPDDGTDDGDSMQSNVVVISNSPPTVNLAQVTPSTPTTVTTLTATGSGWADADGDLASYNYLWFLNGIALPAETNSTLLFIHHTRGDMVSVQITPFDGNDTGPPVLSAEVEILNTPPEAPVVAISPDPPDDPDNLTCSIQIGSFDADSDLVTYLFDWNVNGAPSGIVTNTVPAINTSNGDVWQCTVTPDDGTDLGPTASDFVVVVDTSAPGAPILDPLDEYRNDPLVTLTGNAEPLSVVTVYATCDMGSSGQTVTAANPAGFFTAQWTMLFGEYCDYYVTATDGALNESPPSNTEFTLVCGVPDIYEGGGYGDSPSDPIDEWADLPDDGIGAYTLRGNILAQDAGDWFLVISDDDPVADDIAGVNDYNFHVTVTGGNAEYTFIVYRDAVGPANQECVGLVSGYDDYSDFPIDSGDAPDHAQAVIPNACGLNDAGLNTCENLGRSYYIEVIRDPIGALDCQNYELTVTNGLP